MFLFFQNSEDVIEVADSSMTNLHSVFFGFIHNPSVNEPNASYSNTEFNGFTRDDYCLERVLAECNTIKAKEGFRDGVLLKCIDSKRKLISPRGPPLGSFLSLSLQWLIFVFLFQPCSRISITLFSTQVPHPELIAWFKGAILIRNHSMEPLKSCLPFKSRLPVPTRVSLRIGMPDSLFRVSNFWKKILNKTHSKNRGSVGRALAKSTNIPRVIGTFGR